MAQREIVRIENSKLQYFHPGYGKYIDFDPTDVESTINAVSFTILQVAKIDYDVMDSSKNELITYLLIEARKVILDKQDSIESFNVRKFCETSINTLAKYDVNVLSLEKLENDSRHISNMKKIAGSITNSYKPRTRTNY